MVSTPPPKARKCNLIPQQLNINVSSWHEITKFAQKNSTHIHRLTKLALEREERTNKQLPMSKVESKV